MALSWSGTPPEAIAAKMREIAAQIPSLIQETMQDQGSRAESAMKQNAPWKDRTGNARSGLFYQVENTAGGAILYLGGVMYYQPYLELGTTKMKAYSIIGPTMTTYRSTIFRTAAISVQALFV